MERWCIINLHDLREAEIYDRAPIGCEVLDKKHGPGCFYDNRSQAEEELMRLAKKYPGNDFQLFETVACAVETNTYRVGQGPGERVIHINEYERHEQCL